MTSEPLTEIGSDILLRTAGTEDVAAIIGWLKPAAEKGLLLPRDESEVRGNIANFRVAEMAGQVVGCVALRDFGRGLYEIRSLVVADHCAGRQIGSGLVKLLMRQARKLGARQIFTLTYRPNLFRRLEFEVVDKKMFPQKVWADCSKCPSRDCCDEIALLYRFA